MEAAYRACNPYLTITIISIKKKKKNQFKTLISVCEQLEAFPLILLQCQTTSSIYPHSKCFCYTNLYSTDHEVVLFFVCKS